MTQIDIYSYTETAGMFSHNVYYVKLRVPYNKFMGL